MLNVLKQKNFALLWTGGLISMIGNWVLLAAAPFYVYELTQSALATSAVLMAYIAPGVIFGTVGGVFVDRWDRKTVLIVGNLLKMGAVLLMVMVRSPEMVWLVYLAIFAEATIGQFTGPAENALLPTLVDSELLGTANSLNAMNDNLARLVGPAIGGLVLAGTGFWGVVVIDAVTFAAAALLIGWVKTPARESTTPSTNVPGEAWRMFWRDWLAGLRYIGEVRLLAYTFAIVAFALFGDAIVSALLVVFVQEDMGLTAVEFGWMMTARGIGGLLGALLVAQLSSKLSNTTMISVSLLMVGVLFAIMVAFPTLYVVLPLITLGGIVVMGFLIGSQTLLQSESDPAYLGRVFGAYGTTLTLLMLVGSGLAGLLADWIGSLTLMTGAAAIYFLAGLMAIILYRLPIPAKAESAQPEEQPNQIAL